MVGSPAGPRAPGRQRWCATSPLVGHAGAGKTTLRRGAAGAHRHDPPGRLGGTGTTICDSDEIEARQQRSVSSPLAPLEHDGVKVNLLDTPATPTSSASCAPGCAPPTRRCSSSPPSAGVDALTAPSGRSAPPSACRARSSSPSSTSPAPTSTRPSRSASGCSATACTRSTCRCTPTTSPSRGLIGLLSQRVYDWSSGERVERDPDPQHLPLIETLRGDADRGDHRRERGRDAARPLPRRRGHRPEGPRRRPRDGRRARQLLPGAAAGPADAARHRRAARGAHPGVPHPAGAPLPHRHPPGRLAGSAHQLRPGRPARRRGRQDRHRPLPRSGLPGAGLLRHAAPGPAGARLRARNAGARAPRPRRRRARRRARVPARRVAAARVALPGRRRLRGRQAGLRRDRRHAVLAGRPAARPRRGSCRSPSTPSRSRPTRTPTRTSSAPRCSGWPPRTRRCGSSGSRDRPAAAVVRRRGARRGAARPAPHTGTASRSPPRRCGSRCGRRWQPGHGDRPARQAVRRPRPVRRRPPRPEPAASRVGPGVRAPTVVGRRGAHAVHPQRREGRPHPDGSGVHDDRPLVDVRVPADSTARRTRSTPPTRRSRPPARWPSARRRPGRHARPSSRSPAWR